MQLRDLRGRATLTIEECAALLGRSRSAVYEDAKRERIPVKRLGGRLLVPVPALLAWLGTPDSVVCTLFADATETASEQDFRDDLLIDDHKVSTD